MGGGSSARFPLMYWRGRWCKKEIQPANHGAEASGETILTAASAALLR